MSWFAVDKKGLSKLMERRGKGFVLAELLQNAWDAPGATTVSVDLHPLPGVAKARLRIVDDSPEGFDDIRHAFTLFAESGKKSDPGKRGRFNLGEKLVLAICDTASISTTKGTVLFDGDGRSEHPRRRTEAGTVFDATLPMTREEIASVLAEARAFIPPPGIATTINGEPLAPRTPIAAFDWKLPTEIADDNGVMRRRVRTTRIAVYPAFRAGGGWIHEMGIPVAQGDHFDVDIGQKVPLSLERDSVPAAYLQDIRAAVVSKLGAAIPEDEAAAPWVADALADPEVAPQAVAEILKTRFGDKIVAYDPSDREANSRAVASGYKVLAGGTFTSDQWANIRASGAAPPAGKVTPTPKPFDPEGEPARHVEPTDGMEAFAAFCQAFARAAIGREISVSFLERFNARAAYGEGRLHFNVGSLGKSWFDGPLRPDQLDLLIHELGHDAASDHLSDAYNDALTELGAKAAFLALDDPGLFDLARYAPTAAPKP